MLNTSAFNDIEDGDVPQIIEHLNDSPTSSEEVNSEHCKNSKFL
jgi:hypothetical protein